MSEKYYRKKDLQPMFPWDSEVDMFYVSVSEADRMGGSPKDGDMIAYNPSNPNDKWLVAQKFFDENYEEAKAPAPEAGIHRSIDEMFDKAQPITPEMLDEIGKSNRKMLDEIADEADSVDHARIEKAHPDWKDGQPLYLSGGELSPKTEAASTSETQNYSLIQDLKRDGQHEAAAEINRLERELAQAIKERDEREAYIEKQVKEWLCMRQQLATLREALEELDTFFKGNGDAYVSDPRVLASELIKTALASTNQNRGSDAARSD